MLAILGRTRRILLILALGLLVVLGTALIAAILQSQYSGPDLLHTNHHILQSDNGISESASNSFWKPFQSGSTSHRNGDVIMGAMTNESVKAELGRATWRLLHTMVNKFPLDAEAEERETIVDFIYLLSRLYPCGDCARHFQKLLTEHPPNATSRQTLQQWACDVHNLVNARLEKPQFNCSLVEEAWKCGCSEDT
ncbi:hypothetical protein SeMB42_g01338 [Synchytrium endobioticum]|uniref:Sulfhydryl oxidase n=1 Tax=Synchytrium endobioticum TaxID=286115 RepID=A0A507DM23_9FUNG|nr:hypothetical protein SeLEV6574_g04719 [Synchytrium endobioticum]TPX52566.1 hypothetical protein SeMB42_g01338 [Synchytrium endobioticum]